MVVCTTTPPAFDESSLRVTIFSSMPSGTWSLSGPLKMVFSTSVTVEPGLQLAQCLYQGCSTMSSPAWLIAANAMTTRAAGTDTRRRLVRDIFFLLENGSMWTVELAGVDYAR